MTLLWMDGFDHYNGDAQFFSKGYSADYYSAHGQAGRFGEGLSLGFQLDSGLIRKMLSGTNATMYVGLAVYIAPGATITASSTRTFLRFLDENGAEQVKIAFNASSGVVVYRSSTVIATSANNVIPASGWFYVEAMATISDTVGVVIVRINEAEVINETALDTKLGTALIGGIRLGCVYDDTGCRLDDFYVDDAQFHGNVHVKTFMPDSDETYTDFTRSTGAADYEAVDDNPPNDDTDYIYSALVGDQSTFGITTGARETIKAIQMNHRMTLASPGVRTVKPLIRSNGTDYLGGLFNAITSSYIFYPRIYEADPDDSNPWTQAKLEAAEFGLEIIS